MYASTWICTKERDIVEEDGKATVMQSEMGELRIGKRAMEV